MPIYKGSDGSIYRLDESMLDPDGDLELEGPGGTKRARSEVAAPHRVTPEVVRERMNEALGRVGESFKAATERLHALAAGVSQSPDAKGGLSGRYPDAEEPGGEDPWKALKEALAAKAPGTGALGPIVGAVRQLEQIVDRLGRVARAAGTEEGKAAIKAGFEQIRGITSREGASPEEPADRKAVEKTLERTYGQLERLGDSEAEPPPAPEATPRRRTPQRELRSRVDELLRQMEEGSISKEDLDRRLAEVLASGTDEDQP